MRFLWTGEKVRASLAASAAGWVTAMLVTLPMQAYKIVVNSNGGLRPLLWSLGAGMLVWFVWTLPVAAGGWLVVGLPVVAFVREEWLLKHRWLAIGTGTMLAWLIVLVEFRVWRLLTADPPHNYRMLILYSLLFAGFAAGTASVYLWLLERMRRAA